MGLTIGGFILWELFLLFIGFVSGVGFAAFVMQGRIWFRPCDRTLREMLAQDEARHWQDYEGDESWRS